MENGFFLITGTSRGIGEALTQKVLQEGNTVLSVARTRSERLKSSRYHHLSLDLTDTSRIGRILEAVDEVVANESLTGFASSTTHRRLNLWGRSKSAQGPRLNLMSGSG
jgi:short-subunit dehydrogenase